MQTLTNVHQQFASFFKSEILQPFAYLVSKKLSEGHICCPLHHIEVEKQNLPPYYHIGNNYQQQLKNNPLVTSALGPMQPFVLHQNKLYMQRYFNYETIILNKILETIYHETELASQRLDALNKHTHYIKSLFSTQSTQPDWQLVATITALLCNFTIITGGPGTGKTTAVAKILAILYQFHPNLNVILAAPTGKAAARMAQSLQNSVQHSALNIDDVTAQKIKNLEPLTIHRLLGHVLYSPYFKHNNANPLPYDVVIIDESSMLDVAIFAKLLDALAPQTRIILLGDKNQLASVEAGSLFGDLCDAQSQLNIFNSHTLKLINNFTSAHLAQKNTENINNDSKHPLFEHVVELQYSHRFSNKEGIGLFSKAIITNQQSELQKFIATGCSQQVVIDVQYDTLVFQNFVSAYEAYIHESDIKKALHIFTQNCILCAIREGDQGLYAINKKVEKYLNDKNLIDTRPEFYNHRPILITQNNYALGLLNGDIGIVRPDKQGELKVWFEHKEKGLVDILPALINNAETVYAMTIHKSQGSEFEQVLIILPQQQNMAIITRELLYTAVTRAKSKVVIQASEAVILQAANAQVQRASGIADRFLENQH
jgi:exodeoxyribonuclease V alpha subunit